MNKITEYSEASLYDLQEVIQQYQSQPELLKLILSSKVEEDKRRAEEAKLRAKELNFRMLRHSPYSIPARKHSVSSASSTSSSDDFHFDQRRHSAAAAMLAMGGSIIESHEDPLAQAYPSPKADQYNSDDLESKPKRKREMQAITKIVETREFPYMDNYFWKNNGNTVQKKTGCKSIYYKCSNSTKGCSVNKTVTARLNGEYLIKYRGSHLPECGRVERVRDL